jgi:hypothetical protein
MLPMTLPLEEFNGREKIADLPRKLEWQGSAGSDPEDAYRAPEAELARFEDQDTKVEIVEYRIQRIVGFPAGTPISRDSL